MSLSKNKKTRILNEIKNKLNLESYILSKKQIDLLDAIKHNKLIINNNQIFLDAFSKQKKNQLIYIINKINELIKQKKLWKKTLTIQLENLIDNSNIQFFHKKWLAKNNVINSNYILKDIVVPLNLSEKNTFELLDIINRINQEKKLTNINKTNIKKINNLLNNFFLQSSDKIFIQLYTKLKEYLELFQNIVYYNKMTINNWDIYYVLEKYREYFIFVYKDKLYFFNFQIVNDTIKLKKDKIYYWKYKKTLSLLKQVDYFKIKKIPKSLIEKNISLYYKIDISLLKNNIKFNTIFKKDIINFIKKEYF